MLERQLDELQRAGIKHEVDKKALEKGIAVLNIWHEIEGNETQLTVRFPDVFPYMRFEIYAPGLNLDHHQNPFEKNLCMIGRSTANWDIDDTVAKYIISRLPKVIQTGKKADPEEAKQIEEIQGEPFSDYYTYAPDRIILVDSSWSIDPTVGGGKLKLGASKPHSHKLHYAVLAVMDNNKNILAEAEPEIWELYPEGMWGIWIRSKQPIAENNPVLFFNRLIEFDPKLNNKKFQMLIKRLVIGVLFPEEVAWRKNKDGWLFFIMQHRRK